MNSNTQSAHGIEQQIPRNSLILIMLAQAAVIIPHVNQLSFWIIFLGLACAGWRWLIFRDRLNFPAWWFKAMLVLLTGALILLTEGVEHRLEVWTSFLIVAFALKLVETKTRRDAYAVIFLACFVIATEFVYNQSILISAYQIASLVIVVAAMIGMNQFHTRINLFSAIKLAGKLLGQAIPLMLILFIIFPRVTPFWSVPTASTARTGLSEHMTPGEISALTESDEIAFRAVFDGTPPNQQEMYWRGLVFSRYQLGTWSIGDIPFRNRGGRLIDWANDESTASFVPNTDNLPSLSYQILQEPTEKIWQFGIDLAVPRKSGSGLTWDFRVVSKRPITSLTRYRIHSYPDAKLDKTLPNWLRNRETKLPIKDNPQIIEFAKTKYRDAVSDRQFIESILSEIRQQNFRYTLKPPAVNRVNGIDEFWFETQAGFCMHYAGALTFMLRAVGIPARVVAGYQGGEVNPVTGHVVVRQYHAHAWVEAWLPGQGWQRFDPTAVIAPERIEQGLDAALTEDERDVLSAFTNARLGKLLFVTRMMYLFESFEHRWNMFVVGYDTQRQSATLKKFLGSVTPLRVALVFFIGIAASFLLAGLSILLQKKKYVVHPGLKLFRKFCKELSRNGFSRNPTESPMQFIHRISSEKKLEISTYLPVIESIQSILYGSSDSVKKDQLIKLQILLRNLKRSLMSV